MSVVSGNEASVHQAELEAVRQSLQQAQKDSKQLSWQVPLFFLRRFGGLSGRACVCRMVESSDAVALVYRSSPPRRPSFFFCETFRSTPTGWHPAAVHSRLDLLLAA